MAFSRLTCKLGKIADFYRQAIIIKDPRNGGSLEITLKRTIRVSDNERTSFLPPSLGNFPLFPVREYEGNLPGEMAAKGGLFFLMYQREAMWINFDSTSRFAVKICVGGVNAISGIPTEETLDAKLRRMKLKSENKSVQDYVVIPEQPWLDGIVSEDGKVRQFVAMPTGSGYSVEAQVMGADAVGGLQFYVTPMKSGLVTHVKVTTNKERSFDISLSGSDTVQDLQTKIYKQEGIQAVDQQLSYNNKLLIASDRTLLQENIPDGAQIQLNIIQPSTQTFYKNSSPASPAYLTLFKCAAPPTRGISAPGAPVQSAIVEGERTRTPKESVQSMGIAAGGLIKQSVERDTNPPDIWDRENTVLINAQILNSEGFFQVTGMAPPSTPITAKTYASYNLPFYDRYEENTNIKGDFDGVLSVAQMEKSKAVAEGNGRTVKTEPTYTFPVIDLSMRNYKGSFRPVAEIETDLAAEPGMAQF